MKKPAVLLLCAGFAISALNTTSVFAENTDANQAKIIAEKQIPQGSKYLKTDTDDGKYEILFYHENNQERYEIDVSVTTGKILSFESKLSNTKGSSTITVSEDAAKKKVVDEIPKAEILLTRLDSDDGFKTYEVEFRTDSYYGEYTIHPENATVLERDMRMGTMPSSAKDTTTSLITREKAAELALKEVPDSIMTDLDLDYENNSYIFEVELYKNGYEYELTLDAKTGTILKNRSHKEEQDWSTPQTTENYISIEKARQIALERVPEAVVKECKLDYEDGRAVYEGELRKDNLEYEFEIDAVTGLFLKWEMDYDD